MNSTCFHKLYWLILFSLIASCSPQQPLTIASNSWIGYEPIYAAQALKLTEQPLTLLRKNNATEVMTLFEQGKIDAACLTLDEAMLLIEKDIPLYFAAVLDISAGADQLLATPKLTSLAQLKGKVIAAETTAVGMLLLNSALEAGALTLNDIRLIPATVDKHANMMKQGTIDAAVSFQPFSETLKALGANKLYDSTQMTKAPIVDVLIVSPQAYEAKQAQIKQLLQAVYVAVSLLEQHDPQILAIIGKNLQLPENDWPLMTQGVHLTSRKLNSVYLNRYKLEATMLILNEVMLKNKMLTSSIKDKIHPQMFLRL